MIITVYTKNNCKKCVELKYELDDMELEYVECDVETDSVARDFLIRQGHRALPVMYKDGELFKLSGRKD